MNVNSVGTTLKQLAIIAAAMFSASLNLGAAVGFSLSPSSVSNTYGGDITLNISGLNSGETVVLQEFIDINTNGVIDAGDWLAQQRRLTDGQASLIGGATNINVAGDAGGTDGAIVIRQSFAAGGIVGQMIGRHLYKVSSPTARFTAITNLFTVTNTAYGQSFTGRVRSSGTNVPFAGMLLFVPSTGGGMGSPVGGAIADSSGAYTIKAPPGDYLPWAFKMGFVTDFSTVPMLTLNAGATVTTNLQLVPATQTISGRAFDAANSSLVLPGIMAGWQSANGLFAIGFTDTNGNFSVGVTPSTWQWGGDSAGLISQGYLDLMDQSRPMVLTSTGSVANVGVAFTKGTALFYGTVRDDQNRPLAGVNLSARPNNGGGLYEGSAVSDQNGNYALAVIGGVWNMDIGWDKSPGLANFIFPQLNNLAISDGQALRQTLVGLVATNHITGYLRDNNNNPIPGVGMWAQAMVNGVSFNQNATTDGSGFYSLNVANGTWYVGVSTCTDCGDGLPSNYLGPNSQTVVVANNNGVANFTALLTPYRISGFLRDNNNNPIPGVALWANGNINGNNFNLQSPNTDSTGYFSINVASGTWEVGVSTCGGCGNGLPGGYLAPASQSVGVTTSDRAVNFTALLANNLITGHVQDANNNPIAGVGVWASATINSANYFQYVNADFGGNYSLNVANGVWTVGLETSGGPGSLDSILGSGNYQSPNAQDLTINNGNRSANFTVQLCSGIQITTTNLPNGRVNNFYDAFLQASDCNNVFNWSLNAGNNLPPGLNLGGNGEISGIPTTQGTYNFSVRVDDGNGHSTNQNLSLTIDPTLAPLQVITAFLPNATNGTFYSQVLQATGGQAPYTWSLAPYSQGLPPNLSLSANGTLSGTPTTSGTFYFYARVTDAASTSADSPSAIQLNIASLPLQISTTSLPSGTIGGAYNAALVATGGQAPYSWSLAAGSASLPPGLSLAASGAISGTPTAAGTFAFIAQVNDMAAGSRTRPLSILVNPKPVLSSPVLSGNRFQMLLTGATGQVYTVEVSTDLASPTWNWFAVTNNTTTNSFIITDPNATGGSRFYRVKVGL